MARGQIGVMAPPQYNPSNTAEALEALKQWQTNLQAFLAGVSPEAHGFYPHSSICKLIIDGGSQGTGFWIGNDRILTAGHCVSGASRILVAPGRARTSTIWEVESTDLRSYPGYAPVTDTDIGIIKLPAGHRLNELEAFQLENLNMCPVGGLVVCGYASLITGEDATNTGISGMSVDPDIQHLSSGDFELEDGSSLFRLHSNLTQGTSGGPVFYVDGSNTVHVVGIAVGARYDGRFNIGVNLDQPRLDWINAQ
jgi:V8-like Glu-specific endopeptidase